MNNIYLILICIFLSGCVETSTLYTRTNKDVVYKIDYIDVNIDSTNLKIFPKANEIFLATVLLLIEEVGIDSVSYSIEKFDYIHPDTVAIMNFCINHNIDGLIISRMEFMKGAFHPLFPYDTEVGMKLFDKKGKLISSTYHNTYMGNNYLGFPSQKTMVQDGTKGALKKMIQETKGLTIFYN